MSRLFNRVSSIPSWILYAIVLSGAAFDFTFTYFSIKNIPGAIELNPLHALFAGIFGVNYFLFMAPISIIIIYFAIRLGGRVISKSNSKVKGQNHLAIMLALAMFPNIIFNELFPLILGTKHVKWRHNWFAYIAMAVIIAYSLWIDYETKREKRNAD